MVSMPTDRHYFVEDLSRDDGILWGALLDRAFPRASAAEFAVSGRKPPLPQSLAPFQADVLDQFSSHVRWQHKQITPAWFVRLRLTEGLRVWIRSVPSLLTWRPPLPEDPALYREGQPLLWTISHEGLAFVLLQETEAAHLRNLGFALESQVPAEPPTKRPPL